MNTLPLTSLKSRFRLISPFFFFLLSCVFMYFLRDKHQDFVVKVYRLYKGRVDWFYCKQKQPILPISVESSHIYFSSTT